MRGCQSWCKNIQHFEEGRVRDELTVQAAKSLFHTGCSTPGAGVLLGAKGVGWPEGGGRLKIARPTTTAQLGVAKVAYVSARRPILEVSANRPIFDGATGPSAAHPALLCQFVLCGRELPGAASSAPPPSGTQKVKSQLAHLRLVALTHRGGIYPLSQDVAGTRWQFPRNFKRIKHHMCHMYPWDVGS
jgi:hypothetical protein